MGVGFQGSTHTHGVGWWRNVAGCGMSQCHAVHRDLLCWRVLHGFGGEGVTCEGLGGDVMCGRRHSVRSRGCGAVGVGDFFEGFRCFRERAADVMMRFAMGSESRVTEYKTPDAGVCGELLRWMFADPRFFQCAVSGLNADQCAASMRPYNVAAIESWSQDERIAPTGTPGGIQRH